MFDNWEGLDSDLKDHCKKIKLQRVSQKEIAKFYMDYMQRHMLEPDPDVVAKYKANEFSDEIDKSYGNVKGVNDFICPAELKRLIAQQKMEKQMQQQGYNQYSNQTPSYNQAPPPQQWGQAPPPQQWGQAPPPQQWGQAPPPQQWGQAPPPQQWGQAPPPQQWGQAPPPHPHLQGGAPYNPMAKQAHNPHAYQEAQINESNPFGPTFDPLPKTDHSDIFETPNQQKPSKPAFGGPAGNGHMTGDAQFDDFMKNLDDLKKI